MIKKFAEENTGVHLAVSLHAACVKKEIKIMSINETNNLEIIRRSFKILL